MLTLLIALLVLVAGLAVLFAARHQIERGLNAQVANGALLLLLGSLIVVVALAVLTDLAAA